MNHEAAQFQKFPVLSAKSDVVLSIQTQKGVEVGMKGAAHL
jgi:hypothetical protein